MSGVRNYVPRSSAGLAATLLLASPAAYASGLDAPAIGSAQSGPVARDAAAVHYNPAELAYLTRPELSIGGALVLAHVTYSRTRRGAYQTPDSLQFTDPIDAQYVDPDKTGKAETVSTTPFAPVGDLFVAYPVSSRLVLGAGVYVPYAAALYLPKDGAQAWQIQEAFIVASHVTLSAGVRVTKGFSVGAGISYVGGYAELSKLQDFGSLEDFGKGLESDAIRQPNQFGPNAPTELRELDSLSRPISLTGAFSNGISFNAGLALDVTEKFRLGLTYQHGSQMRYKGKFAIDMNDDFFTKDLAPQGLKYKPLVEGDAELDFALPKRVTLGAGYDVDDRWRLDGFVSYVFYSDVAAFDVQTSSPDLAQEKLGIADHVKVTLPRNWNDTVSVEGSARYRLNAAMLTSVTIGYQSPATPDSTIDMASPDGHRLIGGVGGTLNVTDSVSLEGDLRVAGILPRTVTTSDHDLGNGTYTLVIAAAGGHIKAVF